MKQIGLGSGFLGDLDHCICKGIERILVFRLGRFDHEGFVDDEREVVCRRMEVVVHQTLGNVEGAHVGTGEPAFGDELVHADAVKGNVVGFAQARQ